VRSAVAWGRKVPGRSAGSFACADKAAHLTRQARGQGRGTPQGGEAQESQGAVRSGEIRRRHPNRQRDKTPEARPLRAAMPHAPKAR